MEAMNANIVGLLLADDLMWTSRITGTAQALGYKVLVARTREKLEELARQHQPVSVLFDLDCESVGLAEVQQIQAAVHHPVRFAAYGSHVDVAALQAARQAGCDPVLPRSQMAERTADVLRLLFAPSGSEQG